MWTIGIARRQTSSMESCASGEAFRNGGHGAHHHRSTHAVAGGTNALTGVHFILLIEPSGKRPGISEVSVCVKVPGHREHQVPDFRLSKAGTQANHRRTRITVKRVYRQHCVTFPRQSAAHFPECGP